MPELWTPGADTRPANGLQIWIPDSAQPEPRKVKLCTLCGKRFPESQRSQWDRHVRACAKKNRDRILEQIEERSKNPLLSPIDKERADYLAKNPRNRGRKARHLRGVLG